MNKVYKALSIILISCLSLLIVPFHISADMITDFDYTNYYELNYLESTGTQYIDLGNLCGEDFEIKMSLTEIPASQRGYFGNYQVGNYFTIGYFNAYTVLYLQTNTYKWRHVPDTYMHTYILDGLQFKDIIGNTVNTNITLSSYTLTNPNNFYMFRSNGQAQGTAMRLYYAYIGVHKFIPSERKSDNVLGLYDTYDDTFYTNIGTGDFISGGRVEYPSPPTNTSGTGVISPSGSGTVTGLNGASLGEIVNASAVPNQGYKFVMWSDGNTNQSRSYTVGSGVYAIFEPENNDVSSMPLVGINTNIICIDSSANSFSLPRMTYTPYTTNGTIDGYLVSTNNNNSVYSLSSSSSNSGEWSFHFNIGGNLESSTNGNINNIVRVLKEFEFILDNDYLGNVTISDGTNTHTIYVNGDRFVYTSYDNSLVDSSFTITDYQLTLNNSSHNMNVIVNGTESSNQSVSDLNGNKTDFDNSANDLVEQENQFNINMNNALQNIDTDFDISNQFGSKFLASANWVKTQYDRITGSTPFGTIISFSLLLGLSMLIIGKVYK